jgi:hypothetical protein
MKATFKLMTVLALAFSALGFYAPAALAAAPSNDTFPNATAVSVGFSETLDTTQATTDSDDAQLNASCGAPATAASVWYAIQGTDSTVVVDVSGSNYSAGVLVGTGTQGNLNLVACGPSAVAFYAAAGTTYYVLAIDDQQDGSGNGGMLNISFNLVPAPVLSSFTVDPKGKVNTKTGVATISGTYTCSSSDFIDVLVDASQPVGRGSVLGSGEFFSTSTCDGTSHPWSAQVYPQNGKFAGGKTLTANFAYACGALDCAFGYVAQKVQLSGGK